MIQIGNATLYHGDMRDILPTLGECADLICTDPPYPLESGGKNGEMGGCFDKSEYNNNGSLVDCDISWVDFMPLLYQALKTDSHAYVMSNGRQIANSENAGLAAGFRLHKWLTWDKGTVTPSRWYMNNNEFTGFFFKGQAKTINDPSSKAGVYVAQEDYGRHPTTKPVTLMEYYIKNSSDVGQTVIDPFMGVASTGLAAMRQGRKFIGIEKKEEWFNHAVKRLTDYHNGAKQCSLL